jgi:hypothetical protein
VWRASGADDADAAAPALVPDLLQSAEKSGDVLGDGRRVAAGCRSEGDTALRQVVGVDVIDAGCGGADEADSTACEEGLADSGNRADDQNVGLLHLGSDPGGGHQAQLSERLEGLLCGRNVFVCKDLHAMRSSTVRRCVEDASLAAAGSHSFSRRLQPPGASVDRRPV